MDYKSIIESKYNRQNWQWLLHDIFGKKIQFWATPRVINTSSHFAKQAFWLGTITLNDEQTISIYEVELSDSVDIERNRRGIRDMLLTNWRGNGNAGAFMFCYRKNESVLRFSYVSESWKFAADGSYQKESTNPKRFTYLLGEGHRSRTAIQRFEELNKKETKTLADLTKAFSVDAVSDEFFKGYKEQYEDIVQYVTGKRMVKVSNKWEEQKKNEPCKGIMQDFARFKEPEKAVRDYVKKLMGRLVFLQFLQKKGWLGVRAGNDWGTGDPEFLQTLFSQTKDKDNFIDNVLESLFNDLNNEENKKLPQYRIPYLNGGLFERDATDETKFPLPAKYMQNLLDFFSSYNFTIDENDPDDAEVGVDPEMLGRIFENLLEDNKDKGAFYTPKEIVNYMCRESLIAYLQNDINDESQKEAIRQFVVTHNATALGKISKVIDKRLQDVKICDPAIGSGAFPMGLLKELFLCRTAIEGIEQSKAAEIKKHIIQQNIYGVDIERGAVDIARLRFWLSLIVDEETPQSLPNLDFKIMQGNSLLEQYKGADLSTMTEKKVNVEQDTPLFESTIDFCQKNLRDKLAEYYTCPEHGKKVALRREIADIVEQELTEQGINIDFGDIDMSANNQFFLWHTWFHDVFSRPSKEGFDVVIGNPPYVEAKKLKYIASSLKGLYDVYSGTADLSIYFNELGLNLLAEDGIISFITTNKFFNTGYGQKVREQLSSQYINIILNFEQVEVFEDILVSSVIFNIKKAAKEHGHQFTYEKFYKLDCTEFKREFVQRQSYFGHYPQDYLGEGEWSFADLFQLLLKEKIEKGKTVLKELDGVKVYRGVTTGYNPAFIITDEQCNNLIKEDPKSARVIKNMLQGRNIRKWYYNESDENLIFTRKGTDIELYPAVKEHLFNFFNKLKPKTEMDSSEGRKPGNYKWFEILDNTAYYKEFEKPEKIIWGLTADKWAYTLDTDQHYLPSNAYILTSEAIPIRFILGLLNSKLLHYYFGFIGVMTAGGAYTLKAATIEALPIAIGTKEQQKEIVLKVDSILNVKAKDKQTDVSSIEKEIDRLVYNLYGLSDNEINIVESI